MEKEIRYTELIERYLDGDMSGPERSSFEQELATNKNLAEALELHQEIDVALMEEDVMELRTSLNSIHKENFEADHEKSRQLFFRPRTLRYLAMAASILVVIGFGYLFLFSDNDSPDEIFNEYYEPYESSMTVRSGNDISNDILTLAMQNYETGNYDEAVKLFKQVLRKDQANIPVHLYSGISNMEVHAYTEAHENFDFIIKDHDNLYLEHAEWYLGLCYIKTNEIEKALDQFRRIVESESYYKEQAREIIRKLS